MTAASPARYQFGNFELQPEERRLLSGGAAVAISPRAFDLLVTLVEHEGRLISKDELLERVWPKMVVEENALQAQISALRKILGAEAIETVSRSGYRFTLNVVREVAQAKPRPSAGRDLPQAGTTFIGREKEVAQIRLLLGRTRLLTLTGAGGCGKTRLALQVAQGLVDTYPDGIWFVEFAALADPALVASTVAQALGLKEQPGQSLVQTIAQHLSPRRPLLVLDNAEHLAEAVAALVDAVLEPCEHAVFLITSRQPLGVAGELTYRVPSLSVPDPKRDSTPQALSAFESVRLFVDRARLQRPHFAVTTEIALALASICHQLDGIPLAIELAAPRVRSMSVDELNRRLDQRFGLLTTGPRTALNRQRTLRATLDWSYDLLSETEQALLSRASVFAGGWTLEAAESTCFAEGDDPAGALRDLASLVDKSLVVADERDGATRYSMLQTVRQYAQDRLEEHGSSHRWRTRHLACCLAQAEEDAPQLTSADPWPWIDRLEAEHDNLRAALAWSVGGGADAPSGLRLANAIWLFWWYRGHFAEALDTLKRLLDRTQADPGSAERATALHAAGEFAYVRSELDSAQSFNEQSLAIRRQLGDPDGIARSLNGLGNTAQRRGDFAAARAFHEECLSIWRQLGKRKGVSGALNNLGNLALAQGDARAAKAFQEESLAIRRELGDRWGMATSLLNLASVGRELAELETAKARCEEALRLYRELGEPRGSAYCLAQLGFLEFDQGDHRSAEARFKESLPVLLELGDQWAASDILRGLGDACAAQDGRRAACIWGAAERLRGTIGTTRSPNDRARDQRLVEQTRASLADEQAFDRAWQEGHAMSLQQAVGFALAS